MSYLVTYFLCNAFPFSLSLIPPLPPLGSVYWQPQYDSPTIYFIVLILHLLWITHVCCRKCHRSVLYEITMRFTVCSLSCSSLLLPGSHCVCFSLWCLYWKPLRHKFVLFLCLERMEGFHRMLQNAYFHPLYVGRNNSCCVSNKW